MTANSTIVSNDLNSLMTLIDDTNRAMDGLQNQTNAFAQDIETTPTKFNLFDKGVFNQLKGLLEMFAQILGSLPSGLESMASIAFNQKGIKIE